MNYEHIDHQTEEGIAEIRLDRPGSLNALNIDLIEEFIEILYEVTNDRSVYVIIITGNGRGFCSGADITPMIDGVPDRLSAAIELWKVQHLVKLLYETPTPTIAAVNGPAVGGGCDIALASDIRIISTEGYLREQFVNIGLIPGDGGAWLLPRLIGESKARELLLTGKDITPEMALELGLVTDVVASEMLEEETLALAESIRDKPATAVRRTNELIDSMKTFDEYARKAIHYHWEAVTDDEHEEAITALLEDRATDFDREY